MIGCSADLKLFLRFPIAVSVATFAVLALAYLVVKINPHIIYSSEYAVWAVSTPTSVRLASKILIYCR